MLSLANVIILSFTGAFYMAMKQSDGFKKVAFSVLTVVSFLISLFWGMIWSGISVGYHTYRAYEYYDQGNYEDGIAELSIVLETIPEDTITLHNRGLGYLNIEDYQKAITDLEQVIDLDPNLVEARRTLALAYMGDLQFQNALDSLKEYKRLAGENAVLGTGILISSIESRVKQQQYEQILEQPAGHAYVGFQYGQVPVGGEDVWTYSGKKGEILSILADVNITPETNFLDTYLVIRSPDGSILEENDNRVIFVDTNAYIGDLELPEDGNYEIEVRSARDFADMPMGGPYQLRIESSIVSEDLDATDAVTYYYRSIAYYNNPNFELVIADLERSIELDPDFAPAYLLLGWLYSGEVGNLPETDPQLALRYLNEYVNIQGDRAFPSVLTKIENLKATTGE